MIDDELDLQIPYLKKFFLFHSFMLFRLFAIIFFIGAMCIKEKLVAYAVLATCVCVALLRNTW